MTHHYCSDCDADCCPDGDEWCCGGDRYCDAMQPEPDCVHGLKHRWRWLGGCDSNPGVYSLGGTTYRFTAGCCYCGSVRTATEYGWQRNPGQCDSIEYETHGCDVDDDAVTEALRRLRRNAKRRAARRAQKAVAS